MYVPWEGGADDPFYDRPIGLLLGKIAPEKFYNSDEKNYISGARKSKKSQKDHSTKMTKWSFSI